MRRVYFLAAALAIAAGIVGPGGRALAQGIEAESGFSDTKLSALGYPAFAVTVGEDGIDAPAALTAGIYQVTFSATGPNFGYLDFMLPPPGLSPEEMRQQALDAGASDLVRPGWGFAGGSNTFEVGTPVTFLIDLAPGDYQVAASYYPAEGEYDPANEIMQLRPLTVTAAPGAASPAATPVAAPVADVTLEMTDDLRYVVSPDPIPAGPRIWRITNTGTEQSHHVVMVRTPDGVTADRIVADFAALVSGTPPAGPPLVAQFTGVGYAALQSGGRTTWNEFDLAPGTYAVICYILDPETGVPHVLDGMATVFTAA